MLTHDDTYMYVGCTYVQDVCMYIMYAVCALLGAQNCPMYNIHIRTYVHTLSTCTYSGTCWFSTYSWIVSTPHSVPVYTSCT